MGCDGAVVVKAAEEGKADDIGGEDAGEIRRWTWTCIRDGRFADGGRKNGHLESDIGGSFW